MMLSLVLCALLSVFVLEINACMPHMEKKIEDSEQLKKAVSVIHDYLKCLYEDTQYMIENPQRFRIFDNTTLGKSNRETVYKNFDKCKNELFSIIHKNMQQLNQIRNKFEKNRINNVDYSAYMENYARSLRLLTEIRMDMFDCVIRKLKEEEASSNQTSNNADELSTYPIF